MATQQEVLQRRPLFTEQEMIARGYRGLWTDAWRRMIKNRLAMVALVLLVLIIGGAYLAPRVSFIERHEPTDITTDKQMGPTAKHWFGTDQLGRDIWARSLEGVRNSVNIGVGAQAIVLGLGILFGVLAAFGGRWTDNLVMRFTDIMFSFPDLLFVILLREMLIRRGMGSTTVVIVAIGVIYWTTIARLVRGQMLSLQERDFVVAARALGAPRWRVVVQHMLPNTLGPVIVAITFGIPTAIFAEASLSFIGVGTEPPAVSLGTLVAEGYRVIQRNVWNVVFPSAAIATLMLCFTFLGDGLRDALDPRTR